MRPHTKHHLQLLELDIQTLLDNKALDPKEAKLHQKAIAEALARKPMPWDLNEDWNACQLANYIGRCLEKDQSPQNNKN